MSLKFDNIVEKVNSELITYSCKIASDIYMKRLVLFINEIEDLLDITDLTKRINNIPVKKGRPTTHKKVLIVKKRKKVITIRKILS